VGLSLFSLGWQTSLTTKFLGEKMKQEELLELEKKEEQIEREVEEQLEREELSSADLETEEIEKKPGVKQKLYSIFSIISKRAFFITSMPFYWLVYFKFILETFDARLFTFVVIASYGLSYFNHSWGILNWGLQ